MPETCILFNGQQVAIPLVAKLSWIVCKCMRKLPYIICAHIFTSDVTSRERHYSTAKVSIIEKQPQWRVSGFSVRLNQNIPPKLPLSFKYGHFWLQKTKMFMTMMPNLRCQMVPNQRVTSWWVYTCLWHWSLSLRQEMLYMPPTGSTWNQLIKKGLQGNVGSHKEITNVEG